jgi:hypothetical protein
MEKVKAEQMFAAAAKKAQERNHQNDLRDLEEENVEEEDDTLARRMLAQMDVKPSSKVAATLFAPGKMAYIFEISPKTNDIPTTSLRAMSLQAHVRKKVASIPTSIIDDISNILAYTGTGGRPRKMPAAPLVAEKPAVSPVAEPVMKKRPLNKEEAIFSEDEDEDEDEEQDETKKQKLEAKPQVQKGSYFGGNQFSGDRKPDMLGQVLGISSKKVEAAAKAIVLQKEREKRRKEEEKARNQEIAARQSSAAGAYGSYFQRTADSMNTVGKKEDKIGLREEDEEEKGKRANYVVDEDEDVDDDMLLKSFKAQLDLENVQVKKPEKKRKKSAKQKTNQQMEKIDKIMENKKKEEDDK